MARKILLADDSVTAQNMGRKILADAGYEVITVNNGSAALKKISEQRPDVIVLDVYMPGYSGLEVCQRLKEAQETSKLPVLLTVGKLEPFKPEEAKRARADAFIVKPFEASELLSALSKLEDKIVPGAQSSKPGRFARATAALDEPKYDKSVAIEEDLGWKNRIQFPTKKNEKAAQKESDESGAYETASRDLASVIEHKIAEKPPAAKAEETRVDLGAVAPEGLPKDVTAEEIAALAAAAAQVKGKLADDEFESSARLITPAEKPAAAPAVEPPQEVTPPAPPVVAESKFAENKIEEKPAEIAGKVTEKPAEEAAQGASMIAELPPESAIAEPAEPAASFEEKASEREENEPVTMAVTADAATGSGSHWTAVSLPLAPEEAAISLEDEMRKAYAAFAEAETGHSGSAAANETGSGGATTESVAAMAPLPEPPLSIPAMPAPEAAQQLSAVASASADVLTAAVQELETVAESYAAEPAQTQPKAAAQPIETAVAKQEDTEQPAKEERKVVEQTWQFGGTRIEPAQVEPAKAELAPIDSVRTDSLPPVESTNWNTESKSEIQATPEKTEEPFAVVPSSSVPELERIASGEVKSATPAMVPETPAEHTTGALSSGTTSSNDKPAETVSGSAKDSAETATAAAWASWRRIRETGDSKETAEKHAESDQTSESRDVAARAVAAGAEKTPEEPSGDSDPAIASIVDSVLADLRPKIVEEISRKMGKKK